MSNDDKLRSLDTNTDRAARSEVTAAAGEQPFDRWLQNQLHAMYEEIAREPLPPDLLRLIEKDVLRKNEGKNPSEK